MILESEKSHDNNCGTSHSNLDNFANSANDGFQIWDEVAEDLKNTMEEMIILLWMRRISSSNPFRLETDWNSLILRSMKDCNSGWKLDLSSWFLKLEEVCC